MNTRDAATRTAVPWPEDTTAFEAGIATRFAAVAEALPDQPAVRDQEASLSYSDLDDLSQGIAAALSASGSIGEPVAILIDHEVQLVSSILGAVRAGRPPTVIDPTTPASRILQVLDDADATTILASARRISLAQQLSLGVTPTLLTEDIGDAPDYIDAPPHASSGIFYTSGSTGEPKGALRLQAGILRRACFENQQLPLGPGDVLSLLNSCSFGSSQNDLWTGLLNGGLVNMYPLASAGVTGLGDWLDDEAVTWFHVPVALLRQLLAITDPSRRFASLRAVLPAGRMYGSDVRTIRQHINESTLIYSQFGSTETSLVARFVLDHNETLGDEEVVPFGYEIPGCKVELLDESGASVADGEEGQLVVSSPLITEGYWKKPEMTSKVVDADPARPGIRRYWTGDYVRRDTEGRLVFVGRRDDRVKVRGYRVELNEVGAHVRSLEVVRDAHIKPDPGRPDRLVAYVVPARDDFDLASLRTQLSESLPEHKIPSIFVELEALPLTHNGKVDAAALPELSAPRVTTQAPFTKPRTQTELQIAEIWAGALDLSEVGVLDRFSDLGGESLAAMRVVALVAGKFRTELPLRGLLDHATVASMAEAVDTASTADSVSPIRRAVGDTFPLTHQQQSIWLNEQMSNKAKFNMPKVLDIAGTLDVTALRQAFIDLVEHHDVLRTRYQFDGLADPRQTVVEDRFEELDLVATNEADLAKTVDRVVTEHRTQPFDLSREFPIRACVCSGDLRSSLIVTTHHVVSDRTSSSILLEDLATLYRIARGSSEQLEPLTVRYVDFATWQRDQLEETTEKASQHWRRLLDPPPDEFEGLFRPTRRESAPPAPEITWEVDEEDTAAIGALAKQEGTTPFVVITACLKAALADVTGTRRPNVSIVMSGRERPEVTRMVGCFTSLYPLPTAKDLPDSCSSAVRAERDAMLGLLDHRDVPFDAIVGDLNPARRPGRTPFADVTINFAPASDDEIDFGHTAARRRQSTQQADSSFDARGWEADGRLQGRVTIDPTWVDLTVAQAVVDQLVRRLSMWPAGPMV
ncbi:MAG: condensation domain-containing protein [Acidimicrobiales bacterium]